VLVSTVYGVMPAVRQGPNQNRTWMPMQSIFDGLNAVSGGQAICMNLNVVAGPGFRFADRAGDDRQLGLESADFLSDPAATTRSNELSRQIASQVSDLATSCSSTPMGAGVSACVPPARIWFAEGEVDTPPLMTGRRAQKSLFMSSVAARHHQHVLLTRSSSCGQFVRLPAVVAAVVARRTLVAKTQAPETYRRARDTVW